MGDSERRARLETLFAEHARAVRGYAMRRCDPAAADDVVSEVFVVACRRLDDVPGDDALPWLLACARRVLANQARSGRRQAALNDRLAGEARRGTRSSDGGLARDEETWLRDGGPERYGDAPRLRDGGAAATTSREPRPSRPR